MENLQEAINHCYKVSNKQCGTQCGTDHFQLAKWIEELQQYREIGTVEECRKAMGKQKSKKVRDGKFIRGFTHYKVGHCANCGAYVKSSNQDYCHACGQRIGWQENWEETEDDTI